MRSFDHIIHIGYPKAGSHFVQRWFECHPQIQYVKRGFAGFQDATDLARQSAADGQFRIRATSAEELAAPKATVGLIAEDQQQTHPAFQEQVCKTLAQLFRDPWVLLLTRGFRSALHSGYSQYVRAGGERDFYTGRVPTDEELAQAEHSLNYNHLVHIYRKHFAERLIILPYELLRDRPRDFLRQLETRLGLDPFDAPLDRIHPSLSPAELRWYPRISRAVRSLPLGRRLKRRAFEHYVRSIRTGAWTRPIKLAQRLFPAAPVTADMIPDKTVEYFRGRADCLRDEPAYAAYAEDYLFSKV